jgi:predicted nucleotidyltransferase
VIAAVKKFLGEFTKWASQRPSILAVGLVGSQARGTASACSDVDLIILTQDPEEFLRDTGWAEAFGHPLRQVTERHSNLAVRRVWYQHGLEVEFGFGDEHWPLDAGGQEVIAEGIRVLLDRGPLRDHHDGGAAVPGFSNRG